MKFQLLFKPYLLLSITIIFFVAACAPEVKFFVTKPPVLPVENINTITIGKFSDIIDQEIALPANLATENLSGNNTYTPIIRRFPSNQSAADLVRALVAARLSASNQYRILNTGGSDTVFSGIVPDRAQVGILSAQVRLFEQVFESSETYFFSLLATRSGGTLQEQLAMLAAREGSSALAGRSNKGFNVPVPYIEIVSAMEVTFDFTRDSSGQPIVPTQVFRSYYVRKWGGSSDRSHVAEPLREVIVTRYQKDESTMESLRNQVETLKLAASDPDEFIARGGKLKHDSSVPVTPLEIRTRLAKDIVDHFVKQISQHTEETILKVASGDKMAVNYIKANAYELAINRLENLQRSEADSFNLALAYESIAEYRQASVYYQEALDKNPENEIYKEAIKRVRR